MVDSNQAEEALFPERVGDRLRTARTKAGLDLSDVASRTRVPLRHLQAIESGDYSSFPSATYCVGFVKAYARVVGEDEADLSKALRAELGHPANDYRTERMDYDDADPARIPSRMLAWTAAALALLVVIGYGVWRSHLLDGTAVETPVENPAATEPATPQASTPAAPTAPNASGQVVLTALDPVWLRIYDAKDKVLFEKEMAKGETFTVPADADAPKIRTGRAELIGVTIDGKAVPPLGEPERTIKDVGISAAALAARPPSATPAAPDATAPVPGQAQPAVAAPSPQP